MIVSLVTRFSLQHPTLRRAPTNYHDEDKFQKPRYFLDTFRTRPLIDKIWPRIRMPTVRRGGIAYIVHQLCWKLVNKSKIYLPLARLNLASSCSGLFTREMPSHYWTGPETPGILFKDKLRVY